MTVKTLASPFVVSYKRLSKATTLGSRRLFKLYRDARKDPLRFAVVSFPCVLFEFIILGAILQHFENGKVDTTALTNIGFAIFAAVSSVCFSWLKSLDTEKEKLLIVNLRNCGEASFYAGILFVLASALKYTVIFYTREKWILYKVVTVFLSVGSILIFMRLAYLVPKLIYALLSILYDRVEKYQRADNLE